ncbi:MAG: hypothetical protein HRU28_18410, partial [Rhizobiales bacterium]|nr:hypothetical protein [Hyphomicrobiales bacterium]
MTNLSYLSKLKICLVSTIVMSIMNLLWHSSMLISSDVASGTNAMQIKTVSEVQYSMIGLGIAILFICTWGFVFLNKYVADFQDVSNVVNKVALGEFSNRILNIRDKGDVKSFYDSVNRLIDRTDAYIRETSAVMEHVEQNKYYRVIMEDGMLGSYLNGSRVITKTMLAMGAKVKGFGSITTNFEKNVDVVVTQLSDASKRLDKTANNMNIIAGETTEQANTLSITSEETNKNLLTVSS